MFTLHLATLAATASLSMVIGSGGGITAGVEGQAALAAVRTAHLRHPLRFVENRGQTAPRVRFHLQGGDRAAFFTPTEVVFRTSRLPADELTVEAAQAVVRLRFVGASPDVRVEGRGLLPGVAHFLSGADVARRSTGVRGYAAISYRDLYPGIDLTYRSSGGSLKSEFIVDAGADPAQIRLLYSGMRRLRVGADGSLIIDTGLSRMVESAPYVYQEVAGRRVTVADRKSVV